MDVTLERFARHIETLEWSGLIIDRSWRLSWVSPELQEFLGVDDEDTLGYGRHALDVFMSDPWLSTVHPDSQASMISSLLAYLAGELDRLGDDPQTLLPEHLRGLLEGVAEPNLPPFWSTTFSYLNPLAEPDAAPYNVNALCIPLSSVENEPAGWGVLFMVGVRPTLLALLGRGDQRMYERMAPLVHPGQRQAAILFCDLSGSGSVSRRLSSAEYFRLIRDLWTAIDGAVADHGGIVGKHAGDGATAFFLADDVEGPSAAAAAAISTARRIHELSAQVFADVAESSCLMKVGVHWGASLYMGQLVPGGRLDVTALGDEVNEAARVQEAAGPHETLATKHLIERLSPQDAAGIGLDVDHVTYRMLSEILPDHDKVVRDAGPLPVTAV